MIKKKQIKFTITVPSQSQNKQTTPIKILVDDEHLLTSIQKQSIKFPNNIVCYFNISYANKQINLQPKHDKVCFSQDDHQNIQELFKNIWVFHLRAGTIKQTEQSLKDKISFYKRFNILGFKKFHIETGRFQQADFLIYIKGRSSIKQFLDQITLFFKSEQMLFSLDTLILANKIPYVYGKIISSLIEQQKSKVISQIAQQYGYKIISQGSTQQQKKLYLQKPPKFYISLILSGNRQKIFQFYQQIQKYILADALTLIQIQKQQQIQQENIKRLNEEYTQFRIYKITSNAAIIFNKSIDLQQITQLQRKLKLKQWVLDNFSSEQLRILQIEDKKQSLKSYMSNRKIICQSIEIDCLVLKIVCDRITKNTFIEQCINFLKSFIKISQICDNYDTCLLIQVFKKYYKKNMQDQFLVQFQFGDQHIIRNNYSKYSDDIAQYLKTVREKIRKKIIKFATLKSIKQAQNVNIKFFIQKKNSKGYERRLLGCSLYKMDNVHIKLKKLQSLKRQQQSIIYLVDNRLNQKSIFFQIIKNNKLNYTLFLTDAQRTKKPQRLMQYITEFCPYAHKSILLHAGPVKVTNTIKRDLQKLITFYPQKMVFSLFKHEQSFIWDIFTLVLEVLKNSAENLQPERDFNLSASNFSKNKLEVQFYYEGGTEQLNILQKAMKYHPCKINRIASFCLEQFDIQKIYALRYSSVKLVTQSKIIQLSPILAEILNYQFNSKKQKTKKKFIFSVYQQPVNQLVQFLISLKSRIYHKITHDEGKLSWSHRPYIQVFQQLQPQLQRIVSLIEKYFKRTDYIILSAQSISDGVHGRRISYCTNFYMAQQDNDQLIPVSLNMQDFKIISDDSRDPARIQTRNNKIQTVYEIQGYKDQLDAVMQQFYT